MSGSIRGLRWRAGVTIAGAALVLMYLYASGRGPGYTIQIDYSWGGEYLDSAEVEIDGEVVGVLEPFGRSQRVTGFRVEAGEHVVRILREGCEGVPERVVVGPTEGRLAVRMADVEDAYTCSVRLR